jgi:hypothetical protein
MTTIARYFTYGHMRGVSCRVWDQIRVRGDGLGRHPDTTEGIPNRSFIPLVSRRVACLSQIVPARKSLLEKPRAPIPIFWSRDSPLETFRFHTECHLSGART